MVLVVDAVVGPVLTVLLVPEGVARAAARVFLVRHLTAAATDHVLLVGLLHGAFNNRPVLVPGADSHSFNSTLQCDNGGLALQGGPYGCGNVFVKSFFYVLPAQRSPALVGCCSWPAAPLVSGVSQFDANKTFSATKKATLGPIF